MINQGYSILMGRYWHPFVSKLKIDGNGKIEIALAMHFALYGVSKSELTMLCIRPFGTEWTRRYQAK